MIIQRYFDKTMILYFITGWLSDDLFTDGGKY